MPYDTMNAAGFSHMLHEMEPRMCLQTENVWLQTACSSNNMQAEGIASLPPLQISGHPVPFVHWSDSALCERRILLTEPQAGDM